MITDTTKSEITEFLAGVRELTAPDFADVDDVSFSRYSEQKAARPAMKLPAADFSWIEKRARDTIGPLLVALPWPDTGLSSTAVALTQSAARAIACRDKLTGEQYEAFVGGFRQVGVAVPDHRPAG